MVKKSEVPASPQDAVAATKDLARSPLRQGSSGDDCIDDCSNNRNNNRNDKPEGKRDDKRPDDVLDDRSRTLPREYGGRKGPEPTRYGDWEKNGRCIDF